MYTSSYTSEKVYNTPYVTTDIPSKIFPRTPRTTIWMTVLVPQRSSHMKNLNNIPVHLNTASY